MSPASGSTEGGTSVTIIGDRLPADALVQFGTTAATVTYQSAGTLRVTSPRNVNAGSVDVTLWSQDRHYQVLPNAFTCLTPSSSGSTPGGGGPSTSAPSDSSGVPAPPGSASGGAVPGGPAPSSPALSSSASSGPAATSGPDLSKVRLIVVPADEAVPDWMWDQPCTSTCTALGL